MDAAVAEPADLYSASKRFFAVTIFIARPSVNFLGNQMMKRERNAAPAAGAAQSGFGTFQLWADASAASTAALSSSLSGSVPLPKCSSTSPSLETRYLLKFQRG